MPAKKPRRPVITALTVEGYKSIVREQRIELGGLTILAGKNSSGKSSIMQPLLLMKQTLDASFDPGALLLDGDHVKLTSANEALSHGKTRFDVAIEDEDRQQVRVRFQKARGGGFDIASMTVSDQRRIQVLNLDAEHGPTEPGRMRVRRRRCFLHHHDPVLNVIIEHVWSTLEASIINLIHIPGLRGNPERTYRRTAVSERLPGAFEHYVASILHDWTLIKGDDHLRRIGAQLESLDLTWGVKTQPVHDTRLEILVGRLPHARARRGAYVSIADVGFGVSQILPVIVALEYALPGQMVYIEQPELHLHPKAQVTLGEIFAEAAKRGVRLVLETHSDLLIRGIQIQVAAGKLLPDSVRLHWFDRSNTTGATTVTSATMDEQGAFGDWPADLDSTALLAEKRCLDTVSKRRKRSA